MRHSGTYSTNNHISKVDTSSTTTTTSSVVGNDDMKDDKGQNYKTKNDGDGSGGGGGVSTTATATATAIAIAIAIATAIDTDTDTDPMNPNDVLCGRGTFVYSHFGNHRFRTLVTEYRPEYMATSTTTQREKREVLSRILACITESGGRFLQSNDTTPPTTTSTWSKLTHPKIVTKITKDVWNASSGGHRNSFDSVWKERLQQLVDFQNEFQHTNVPQRYTENTPLGTWVRTQRKEYKQHIEKGNKPSSLTKERIAALNQLGFVWRLRVRGGG